MARKSGREIYLALKRAGTSWRYALVAIWVIFTLSLTGWWIIFGLRQIDTLMALDHNARDILVRQQKMLLWEGGALIVSLFAGGGALLYFLWRDVRRGRELQRFFATFTHELKTPLASLRLQAEALREECGENSRSGLLERLIADTGRLNLQLENSLFIASVLGLSGNTSAFHCESISIAELVESIEPLWPNVAIVLEGKGFVFADRRFLESVFQNLVHNSCVHGHATAVSIALREEKGGKIRIRVADDGAGFLGNRKQLGIPFVRFYSGSGSGIGLYLCRTLVTRMGGEFSVADVPSGFVVDMVLPGGISVHGEGGLHGTDPAR